MLAVPVAAPETVRALSGATDEVVCLEQPEPFIAIGVWYRRFEQVGDDEVIALLERARVRCQAIPVGGAYCPRAGRGLP